MTGGRSDTLDYMRLWDGYRSFRLTFSASDVP